MFYSISSLPQTIYEFRGSVEPHKSSTVGVRQSAILKYHIRNVSQNDSKQQLPNKLYYCVQVDARHWTTLDSHEGVVRAPLPGQMVQVVISVSPNASGLLPLPTLILCKCPDDFNLTSPHRLTTTASDTWLSRYLALPIPGSPDTWLSRYLALTIPGSPDTCSPNTWQ